MERPIGAEWNSFHENLLRKWAQTSKTFAIMHNLSAAFYAKWDRWLGIPVVLLGAVTASSIFATSGDVPIEIHYANGCLALLTAGLTGVSRFLGYAEKRVKHQTAAVKYTDVSMEVDAILSFPRSGRVSSPQEFINVTKKKMLDIREAVPEILPSIMTNYLEGYDRSLTRVKSNVNRRVHSPAVSDDSERSRSPDVGYGTSDGPIAAKRVERVCDDVESHHQMIALERSCEDIRSNPRIEEIMRTFTVGVDDDDQLSEIDEDEDELGDEAK